MEDRDDLVAYFESASAYSYYFLVYKEHMDLFLFQHALYGWSHESGNFVAMAPGLSIRCTLGREMRSLFSCLN